MIALLDRRRWLPLAGAAIALTLAAAACGDDTPAGSSNPAPTTTSTPGSDTEETSPSQGVELDDALGAVGTRYAFTAEVFLDGVEVTRVSGTVYDGAGAYLVTAGGSDVEYVVSDQGQWARQPGADWALLADSAPLADPIAPLMNPLATTVLEADDNGAVIEAIYDGSTLGFSSGGEVAVTVTINDGTVTSISYDALIGSDIATVVTRFDGTADVAPIEVPPT